MSELIKIFIARETTALSLGANEIADAIVAQAASRGVAIEVVRCGSRGACWLEPLVEVVTPGGRVAFGPIAATDVTGLFEAGYEKGRYHPLRHGSPEDYDRFSGQNLSTFW